MDANSLSETYLRAKRYAVFFSGVLVLTSVVGLKPAQESSLVGWSIDDPENTRYVLYVVVLYYMSQLALFWDAQGKSIRELAQHTFDFWLSFLITLSALWSLPVTLTIRQFNHPTTPAVSFALFILPLVAIGGYRYLFRPQLRRSRDAAAEREADVLSVLTNFSWLLVFNATSYEQTTGAHGSKVIIFKSNGDIATGRNSNENTWRVNAGYLELLDAKGAVFSRFTYDPQKERFINTNDQDLQSLKNQYMLKNERLYQ